MMTAKEYRELMENVAQMHIYDAVKEYRKMCDADCDEEEVAKEGFKIQGMMEMLELFKNSAFLTDTPEYEDEKREVEEDRYYAELD